MGLVLNYNHSYSLCFNGLYFLDASIHRAINIKGIEMKTIHWTDRYGRHSAYYEGESQVAYFIRGFLGEVSELKKAKVEKVVIEESKKREG